LKAYLSKVGIPVTDLKNRYAHDLQALWVEAVAKGLTESPQPPDWCVILNQTHNKPYHLRYPLDINGFSIPAFSVVVPALTRLIDQLGSYRIASKRNIANRMTEQIGKSRKL
jgi:hypothetical protein